nr:reverse transcriptase domain-containing protein [Tanacetum cinerariifolium]
MEKLVLSLVFAAKRLRRMITKIERHAGRTQYHVPAKDVGERTGPSGFPCRNAGRKSARRISSRNLTRAVDTLHGWIVMDIRRQRGKHDQISGKCQKPGQRLHQLFYKPSTMKQKQESKWPEKKCINQLCTLIQTGLGRNIQRKIYTRKGGDTMVEEDGTTWITRIIEYLKEWALPSDKKEARKLRIKSRQNELMEGHARETTVSGGQSHTAGILLANDAPGLAIYDMYMKRLSNTSSRNKKPPATSNPYHGSVAVLQKRKPWRQSPAFRSGHTRRDWNANISHRSSGRVVHNDKELRLNLDLLEERRKRAAIRKAKAKLKMTKYYNARVHGVTFRPSDFVYRSNDASHAVDGGKLGPKWEGPYEVTKALRDGSYKLSSIDGTVLPKTWNIANLKKCYL